MSAQHNKSFLEIGSLLVRHGMREADALRALTINGAKAILMDHRIGSLEAGKDADIALLSGPPFALDTVVTHTLIDGEVEFARTRPPVAPLTRVPAATPLSVKATAQSTRIAIVNATVFPISRPIIHGGTVLIRDGEIEAVGAGLAAPAGYDVIDAGKRVVMPGMVAARAYAVNAWSPWWSNTAGMDLADERVRPITADLNPIFNVDPFMPNWKVMRELGLTTYLITPGNGNVIGGQGVVIRGIGRDLDAMVRSPRPTAMVFSLTAATRRLWAVPGYDEGGVVTMLRQALDRARTYRQRRSAGEPVAPDPQSEALIPVLERETLAIFNADTVAEIRTALAIADDYRLRIAISSAVEAAPLAAELSARGIPVILGNSGSGWSAFEDIRGRKDVAFDDQTPARLAAAGVKVALFGPGGHRGNLPIGRLGGEPILNAAWAMRNGMSEADALRMITLNGAEVAGVGDRLGSLDAGKWADVVVFDGHPLALRAKPVLVFIDGRLIFERTAAVPGAKHP